jgi:Xaa-Pro aminopeptidase
MGDESRDFQEKIGRLQRVLAAERASGVLLARRANFAWLSGGRSNGIDLGRDMGAGALLVGADGRCRVLADVIEMPRLLDEALAGLDVEPIEFPWADEVGDPGLRARIAREVLGASRMGADVAGDGFVDLSAAVRRARAPLTAGEVVRYRTLGHDVGVAVGDACRRLTPGLTELEVARLVGDAAAAAGARCPVLLVGADARIERYRHPVPTRAPWTRRVMVVVCAERDGLVVALTRIVGTRASEEPFAARTAACAQVFAAMAGATQPGASGAEVFDVAARAYALAGAPDEERRHHQGGAIGYETRDWIAHPRSDARIHAPQAVAWNPSITGTKVEDTLLVDGDRLEVITASPAWPVLHASVGGRTLPVADALRV